MVIYFVVLNFNTAHETQKLIDSIYKNCRTNDDIHIIVVDNNSTDDSIDYLHNLYDDNKNIEIYSMPSNIGFSRANNFGYQKVLKYQNSDICIVCNSDILIVQDSFFDEIEKEFGKSKFDILSPDVRCQGDVDKPWKGHQSPAFPFEFNEKYIKLHYKRNILSLEHSLKIHRSLYQTRRILGAVLDRYYQMLIKHKYKNYRMQRHEDIPVHGSFIILSSNYMKKNKKLFEPETLFYGEETLLFIRAKKENLKVVYSPLIYVNHLQGKSTGYINSFDEKNFFIKSNLAISDLTILKEMR